MNFVDRIKDSTTTTGTGAITTAGAAIGFQALTAIGAVGSTFKYGISSTNGSEWEIGLGTLTAANSFSRSVISSSNGNALVNFSAGTKDVYLTLDAASVKKYDGGTSSRVVYLSNYVLSDTDLTMYSPVAGVDQRAKIQAVLDLAQYGQLVVVWDVKVTVANVPDGSGNTLRIWPNTTVNALNGCGALQAANSTGRMWLNKNPTTNANNNAASIIDENITITGGIWHGNVTAQASGQKNDVFNFFGVRNLDTNNYKIIRSSGMAFRCINIDQHRNSNYLIDFGAGNATVNTDGMHYHGPATGLRDFNGRILNGADDAYALNADDAWGAGNFTGPYDNVWGPISDVKVDNLYINSAMYGIRIYSGASRIDDIFIRNLSGSTTAYGILIDNFFTPSQTTLTGPGNFGYIRIDGYKMKNAVYSGNNAADWMMMSISVNAKVEHLVLENIVKKDFNNQLFPAIRFGEKYNGDQLEIHYTSRNYNGGSYMTEQIDFLPGAQVKQATIDMNVYAANSVNGYPLRVQAGATITQMSLRGQGMNFTGMMNNLGTVSNLSDTSKMVAAASSTWLLTAGFSEVSATSLVFTGKQVPVQSAIKPTPDAHSGNTKVSVNVKFTGAAANGGLHAAIILRGTNTLPYASTNMSCYVLDIDALAATFKFQKSTGAGDTQIGSIITASGGIPAGAEYACSVNAMNSTFKVRVQRVSDSLYLQTSGAWAAAAVDCIAVTDSTYPSGSGLQYGVYGYNANSDGNTIYFTNFSEVAAT